jgi:hypothetical protein
LDDIKPKRCRGIGLGLVVRHQSGDLELLHRRQVESVNGSAVDVFGVAVLP